MDIRDRSSLKQAAGVSLSQASYDPKLLILLHTGVILLVNVLLALVDYLLAQQIGTTGGLSGLGMRSFLTTVQSVLQLAQVIFLPFWQIGYLFAVLKISRGEPADPRSLTEGFRHLGPVLRLKLLQGLLYGGIAVICVYAGTFLYLMTPGASSLMRQMLYLMMDSSIMENPDTLQAALYTAMEGHIVPLLLISLAVFLCGSAPVFYHYRLADMILMDRPSKGALHALRTSRKMMKGNCMAMVKLDLGFWRFYLLEGLALALCYGDFLLAALGVALPGPAAVHYFAFLILSLLAQLWLYWWRKNEISVTYAKAYAALLSVSPEVFPPFPVKQFFQ